MRKFWTVADVMAQRPCFTEDVVAQHFAGAERLTIQDILRLPTLSAEHKVWMACRPDALTPAIRIAWIEHTVTRAVTAHALTCGVAEIETWAKRWLSGEDRTEGAAARAARAAWAAEAAWAARAARAAEAARAAWAARAAEAARAARAAWAAEAAGAAWAAWAARAAEAAEAAWAARAAEAAWAARAAEAAWAARAAEYQTQVDSLLVLLSGQDGA